MAGLTGGVSALDISPAAHLSPGADENSSTASTYQTQCDIFNTTFSLYQASPLFLGEDLLSGIRLAALSSRLRDVLVGDVVRGVEVGLDNTAGTSLGSAGSLESVTIEWVATDAALGVSGRALQTTLQYENALCSALLLPAPTPTPNTVGSNDANNHFLHLPLLFLRMPTPLKSVVISFFCSTFDCRIGPLHLSSDDLIQRWEAWAQRTALPTTGPLVKDTVLTLCFHLPGSSKEPIFGTDEGETPGVSVFKASSPGLRAVDIIILSQDLPHFFRAGKKSAQGSSKVGKPFTRALAQYLKCHLSLDMSNSAVSVVRIACGGFVLAESRIKIFSTPETGGDNAAPHQAAVQELLKELAMRATNSL